QPAVPERGVHVDEPGEQEQVSRLEVQHRAGGAERLEDGVGVGDEDRIGRGEPEGGRVPVGPGQPALPVSAAGPICATSRARSGPSFSSTRKPSSSRIGTSSETALSYLDPGASPTTTNAVLAEIDPAALAPRSSSAAFASSRENPVSDPVTTMDRPASVCSGRSATSSAIRTPAAVHLSTIATCQ